MNSPSDRAVLAPPRGFRDILPTEARELRVIEQTLTETFAAYGYMPLEPPMVEYAAAQPSGERLIQFLDSDGSLVALRPDLTTAVARLVAQRDAQAGVLERLREGDVVGALRTARETGAPADELDRARRTLGVIGRDVEGLSGAELNEVREVIHLARERWPGADRLWGLPNLGLVPALPYYTGIVFEALHPEVGVVASGGRYDLLIGAFGAPRPATGFAIDVLRLHRALFAEGWRPASARPLVTLRSNGDERATLRCAASLRAAGLSVAIGDVAESAGVTVVVAAVVDERRARLDDGRVLATDELARALAT